MPSIIDVSQWMDCALKKGMEEEMGARDHIIGEDGKRCMRGMDAGDDGENESRLVKTVRTFESTSFPWAQSSSNHSSR